MGAEISKPMVLSCAGAANVGQLSNQAAVELVREGYCRPFCLAAIGAHKKGYVRAAKEADSRVVIDGCSVGCARIMLEQENITPDLYIVVTELGIEKAMSPFEAQDLGRVKQSVISWTGTRTPDGNNVSCECCGKG
jgi:uncharacterized metal-binding protein